MMKSLCSVCGKYGRRRKNHNSNVSLPVGTKSVNDSTNGMEAKQENNISTLKFVMAVVTGDNYCSELNVPEIQERGPLVDDEAPYSAIGQVELQIITSRVGIMEANAIDAISEEQNGCTHWQYGTGEHSSEKRLILGSTCLSFLSHAGISIKVCHKVLEEPSQWILGRNNTRKVDIEHVRRHALTFPLDQTTDSIRMIDCNRLSSVPTSHVTASINKDGDTVLSAMSVMAISEMNWSDMKKIVDKFHRHICGHEKYTEIKCLLEHNDMQNDIIQSYVTQIITDCRSCHETASPQPNGKKGQSRHYLNSSTSV